MKKNLFPLVTGLSLIAASIASAQGVLTLQGQVTQRTPDTIVLHVRESEYKIQRSKLAQYQEKDIEKGGATITLQVPIDAIQDIRSSKHK